VKRSVASGLDRHRRDAGGDFEVEGDGREWKHLPFHKQHSGIGQNMALVQPPKRTHFVSTSSSVGRTCRKAAVANFAQAVVSADWPATKPAVTLDRWLAIARFAGGDLVPSH